MKTKLLSILALALSIAACTKETAVEISGTKTFTFTGIAETMTSKAGLAADGKSVKWNVGDTARLYFQKGNIAGSAVWTKATVTSVDAQGAASFTAEVPAEANLSEVWAVCNDKEKYVSETDFHPYKDNDKQTYRRHRIVFSPNQTAVAGNYDETLMPLAGHWKGTAGDSPVISFKNTAALLCVNLTNNSSKTIQKITLSNTAILTGQFYWIASDGQFPSYLISKDSAKEISLSGDFSANGKYYFIISGDTKSLENLVLTFYASDETFAKFTNTTALAVERNKIYNIGNFALTDSNFKKGEGIEFSDTKVNMDEAFYTKLIAQCTVELSTYKLSKSVTIDNVTLTPGTTGYFCVDGNDHFIYCRGSYSFTSLSAGNAEFVLYCSIYRNKALTLTWTDKDGKTKEVPAEITTALTNTSTSKDAYYNTDDKALHLMLNGVEIGDVLKLTYSGTDAKNNRMYKFYWKAQKETKAFGTEGKAGQDGTAVNYPSSL